MKRTLHICLLIAMVLGVIIFLIIGSVVTALGIAGFWLISEPKLDTRGNENYFKNLFYGFKVAFHNTCLGTFGVLLGLNL